MHRRAEEWPESLRVAQVRLARPTDRLGDVVRFYVAGLGLRELYRFENHAGYDGVMVGLPGAGYHLEFTSHVDGSPGVAPSAENLLVLYFAGEAAMYETAQRLGEFGVEPVEAENPYWTEHGALTFPDPDGWRVVLMPRPVLL
ncbi:VOC family protein [Nocardia farcinica]|uniref:VOC family protein n=1 Tax=Nocardia farcinica TaxID=37329 RepID=UPI001895F4D3|nr:VOC family protein [Nocardia farcinica]MBF6068788.1 VOC family protein [Nocardia farcinica]MBF6139548.1 VOC family protein [Nocardia farcinica]MBF6250517.1 VOC family protein [Nocardia farcinica]MBF6256749.1 VOC family protein [Nocardia farcinica]MBF6262076.1 VOC family protein [Nocardia farcinica]